MQMGEKILAESPTMLFSREFENLHDDGFEGSLDEQRIFNEIFFESDGIGKKGIIVSEATALHCEYTKQSEVSICSNSGKSSLTSQDEYTKEEFARKHPLEYPSEIISSIKCSNEVGLSVGYLPDVKPESGISQEDSGSACQSLMCRVVESSGQGVTSSSYILQPLVYSDRGCEINDRDSPKNGVSCSDPIDQRETAKRAVPSPISQESYASGLLVNDPPVSKLVTSRPAKTKWKESCFVKLDEEEFAMPKDLKNDPRPLLRYHINRLLRAAGWVIGRRKRNSKYNGIGEYVYKSPGGRPIREFHRVWWMCGEILFTNADIRMQTSDDMQWTDIAELWTDLSSTVKEIDDKLNILENTSDMAHLWYLLDPFANVVFIEKTIRLLKEGITVKAKRSFASPHTGSPAKLQKLSRSDRSHLNPRPRQDCGYNGISQIDVRLFDVPNNSGASQLRGGPESLILHQDCSTSSPCFDKAKNEEGDFDHIRQNHKKSRKISEMKLTENYFGERYHYALGETSRAGRRSKKSKGCGHQDDDLLISAVIKTKTCGATNKGSTSKSKPVRRRKTPKGSCKLLPRSLKKGAKHIKEGNWYAIGSRTVLSWLIHCGVVSLNEVIQYRDLKDDAVIKNGLVTRDGIFCKCCSKVLSISEFNSHGGFRSILPSMNLFMESGKPFISCQLEAWLAEYKARKVAPQIDQVDEIDQNDDSCGRCGDVGELICCDNCPSAFHQACLFEQELPEGNWYCPQCRCQICADVVNDKETIQHGVIKCSQCEHKYHETCMQREDMKVELASDTWFCGGTCQKVYTGLQSRTGLKNLISDGFSWTLLRCIPCDEKVHSSQSLVALKAECNSKLAVAITIMEECFLPMVDMKTGIDMIPQVMYNWGSQFARLNYSGFYTAVLEKDDVVMSVASIRIHGVAVAELPLVATCSKNRRQGLCRRLINSIEEMLKALKVEKLVVSAIPNLVETWTIGFGFQPLDEDERESLSKVNLMVFPGAVWLKKPLYESCTLDEKSDHLLNQTSYSIEQGQLPIQEDNIETGICLDDPKNLQPCNGHHHFPILEDPKPSCHHSPVQETNGTTRNICRELENASLNDFLPSQPSEHDEAAIPSTVREAGFQDSEDLKSGESQKMVYFLDELSESYSHVVHDRGILHGPAPKVSSEELVCRTEPKEMHIERRMMLTSCKTSAIEPVGE